MVYRREEVGFQFWLKRREWRWLSDREKKVPGHRSDVLIWGFEPSGCQKVQFCSWVLFWLAGCSWIAWWAATTAAWRVRWTCGRPCTQLWLTWYPAWSSSRMASSTWRSAWPGWTLYCRNCLILVNLQPSSRAIKFFLVFFVRMLFGTSVREYNLPPVKCYPVVNLCGHVTS